MSFYIKSTRNQSIGSVPLSNPRQSAPGFGGSRPLLLTHRVREYCTVSPIQDEMLGLSVCTFTFVLFLRNYSIDTVVVSVQSFPVELAKDGPTLASRGPFW